MPKITEAVVSLAKRAACLESAPQLLARHFLAGAMADLHARALIAERAGVKEGALAPVALTARVAEVVAAAPVTASIPLGDDIRDVFQNLYRAHRGLPPFAALLPVLLAVDDEQIRELTAAHPALAAAGTPVPVPSSPLAQLMQDVNGLQNLLTRKVIGQQPAMQQIADAVFQARIYRRAGEDTPQAVMLFLGPPGIGKTYTAQLIAHSLHGDREGAFLRLDMSSYADHDAYRMLVGFEPSYQGARPGLLTEHVSRHPDCLILVDEIEKASSTVHNLFLQILDRGQLEDKFTRTNVAFGQTIIVFTTNLGTELYASGTRSGFLSQAAVTRPAVMEALRAAIHPLTGRPALSPELCSRLAKGYPILFSHLRPLDLEQIVQLAIDDLGREFEAQLGLALNIADPRLLTLLILRLGPDLDARTVTAGIPLMIKDALRDVFTEHRDMLFGSSGAFDRVRTLTIDLPRESERAWFDELGEGGRRILVVSDQIAAETWRESAPDNQWTVCADGTTAVEAMRRESPDLVLIDIDLHRGAGAGDGAAVQRAVRQLRAAAPDAAVYLMCDRAVHDQPSPETLDRMMAELGACGYLAGPLAGWPTGTDSPLEAVRSHRLRDAYLREMFRLRQTVRFDWDITLEFLDGKDGEIILRPRDIHAQTVVASKDRVARLSFTGIPAERFDNVAGAGEAKRRLREIIGWIRNPESLRTMGVDLPSGILLEGPPGNGKTLLARATAGEANLPFFAVAATDFVSKYVGESEANIRELFERAATYAPSILFIDEIDAIGASRSAERAGVHDSMLNQLLVSMDGFTRRDRPIFFLAATNRADLLDPALKRPGRFDLVLTIEDLDVDARAELLAIMTRKLPLAADADLAALARAALGLSGAQLSQVVKEAAILAHRDATAGGAAGANASAAAGSKPGVTMRHLRAALTNVRHGVAREGAAPPLAELQRTACHEAGHALLAELEQPGSVHQATVLPRGRALGFVESLPESEYASLTAARIRGRIRVALAGRCAEIVAYGMDGVSSGCSQDLEHATRLATLAVSRFGMSNALGPVSLPALSGLLTASAVQTRAEDEVIGMIKQENGRVAEVLERHNLLLDRITRLLMDQETVSGDELRQLVAANQDTGVVVGA
ncbi:MAG: AAA family ATPase [Candidatus Krumholzibacteria bacterium]|jgi:ATP-dependent metalloprotease FtsH|nr:AAA family ATPase [Candidatus Krumholzibacteria bacterium]